MGCRWSCIASGKTSARANSEHSPPKWVSNTNAQMSASLASSPALRSPLLSDFPRNELFVPTQTESLPSFGRVKFNNIPMRVRNLDEEISQNASSHNHPFTFQSPSRGSQAIYHGHSPHLPNSQPVSSQVHHTHPHHAPYSHSPLIGGSPISIQLNPNFYRSDSPSCPGISPTFILSQEQYSPHQPMLDPLYPLSQYSTSSVPFLSVYSAGDYRGSPEELQPYSINGMVSGLPVENSSDSVLGLHLHPEYPPSTESLNSFPSNARNRGDITSRAHAPGGQGEQITQARHFSPRSPQAPSTHSSPRSSIRVRQTDGKVFVYV